MSKRASFTPGPWMVDEEHFDDVSVLMGSGIDEPDCYYTAHRWFCEVEQHEGDEEALANARLIASAPDLLEALQNMIQLYYGEDRQNQAGQYARAAVAAIAKATGVDHTQR